MRKTKTALLAEIRHDHHGRHDPYLRGYLGRRDPHVRD